MISNRVDITVTSPGRGYEQFKELCGSACILDALTMPPDDLLEARLGSFEDYERAAAAVVIYGTSVLVRGLASRWADETAARLSSKEIEGLKRDLRLAHQYGIGERFRSWLNEQYEFRGRAGVSGEWKQGREEMPFVLTE